jgi:hypothetical protein
MQRDALLRNDIFCPKIACPSNLEYPVMELLVTRVGYIHSITHRRSRLRLDCIKYPFLGVYASKCYNKMSPSVSPYLCVNMSARER